MSQDNMNFNDFIAVFKDFSRKIFQDLNNLLREIKKALAEKERLYFSEYEIVTRRERGLSKIVQADDFAKRYKKLLANLSEEDKETLFLIMSRLTLLDSIKRPMDIFTEKEKSQLAKVDQFKQSIIKIKPDLYCYKDYFLPANHFEPSVFLYRHGLELLRHPERIKNKAILDIGAYIGDSALILHKLTGDKVYSFEPMQANYDLLLKTIELNELENVVPIKAGAGAEDSTIEIYSASSSSSADQLMALRSQEKEDCRIIKIDDFVREKGLEVGLIKVDIEGFEQQFIKGASETIKTQKPVLLLSIYHNVDDLLDIKSIIEEIEPGYKFRVFKPVDGTVSGEILLICEIGE